MANKPIHRSSGQVQAYRRRLQNSCQFPITKLLPVTDVDAAVTAEGCSFRDRLFTPVITVWIFLGQVLDQDHSCRQAVLRFVAWLSAFTPRHCSSEPGAYCQARKRLPEGVLSRLTRGIGARLEEQSPGAWHWFGRRVRPVDGTTVSVRDTAANQKA